MSRNADLYVWLSELDLDRVVQLFRDAGAKEILVKPLAANDNSKNQIYVGADFTSISEIPTGEVAAFASTSRKPGEKQRAIFRAQLPLRWFVADGSTVPAESATVIFYPQYPEVRLSGFLQGCSAAPSKLLNVTHRGREPGRFLLLGVTPSDSVAALVVPPESPVAKALAERLPRNLYGVFERLETGDEHGQSSRQRLFGRLCAIHVKGWIPGRQLDSRGNVRPCAARNCGGLTLEAELGIGKNSSSEPDFEGWEIKHIGVAALDRWPTAAVTLFTPEPTAGYYVDEGPAAFIRRFGYADRGGTAGRTNFGGIYAFRNRHHLTGLALDMIGFDESSGKVVDSFGGIALLTADGETAAFWSFAKLMDNWKRKHENVVFVPGLARIESTEAGSPRQYRYGRRVLAGCGTDFNLLLRAFHCGNVFLDPALKLVELAGVTARPKCRNQFRVKFPRLASLYRSTEEVDVCSTSEQGVALPTT